MDTETLNDRIRHLCAQAMMARDDEIEPILTELRESIHQRPEIVRTVAIQALVRSPTDDLPGSSSKVA